MNTANKLYANGEPHWMKMKTETETAKQQTEMESHAKIEAGN